MLRDDEGACRKACYRNTVHVHPPNAFSGFTIHNKPSVIFCFTASNNDAGTGHQFLKKRFCWVRGKRQIAEIPGTIRN